MSTIIGCDRAVYPSAVAMAVVVLYVLVQGEANDVACYAGSGPAEWVAEHGDKVSVEEAEIHFPGLRHTLAERGMTYRR